jgi:glycerophosphoryl diester phosphodiesterase
MFRSWCPPVAIEQQSTPSLKLCAGFALLCALSSFPEATAAEVCQPSAYVRTKPLVIAHASGTFFGPGNTIWSMRAALQAGADALDADVRVTSDGVLVAAHDDDLKPTTGRSGFVSQTSYAQLQKLDVAYTWKDAKGKRTLRGKGVRIPTIEEVLVAFPKRRLSLEFKVAGGEQTMCDLLRRTGRTADVWVGSAGDTAVDRFKPICPEVTTTVTDAMVPILIEAQSTGSPWCAPVPIGQPPFYRDGEPSLTKESVAWNHQHGLAVFTWTVNDRKGLKVVGEVGADAVYTDRPDLARQVFDAKQAR